MIELIDILKKNGKTIATMESCTGGALVNEITNIDGASAVIKFSAVTYSNEFKIKMGVDHTLIEKFSVYSLEVAREMSKQISLYANSDYGVGITGKINRIDKNNLSGFDNVVFVSLYNKNKDEYLTITIEMKKQSRKQNKQMIVDIVIDRLMNFIN